MAEHPPKDTKPRRLDRKSTRRKRKSTAKITFRIVAALLLAAVALLNLFTHVLPVVRYYGDGMEPTLSSGQFLILHKTQKVEEGDLIAFYYNNKVLVRRVVCEGGNQIEIENDGTVSINGEVLEEPYLAEKSIGLCNLTFPYYVQSGYVFVMGDNRTEAMDSRLTEIGPIPTDRIIGKVLLTL